MDDTEVVSCCVVFLALWLFYGFKWAFLIVFTIILVLYTIRNYSNGSFSRGISNESSVKHDNINMSTTVNWEMDKTKSDFDEMSQATRRNPVLTKRDLVFTDLQMNRNSPRPRNSLKSPQPLISQINRHLSFNNMSYYPEQARPTMRHKHQENTSLHNTSLNNSYLLSPISTTNTSQCDTPPRRKPCLNLISSASQERYSPRCFSVLDPAVNMVTGSPSMVKISQPSSGADGSLSFESILQKRLQRTKENPCSRHSVLSALTEKSNRKRTAFEADGSFMESTYAVKKRRRDDLDDFLDSVSDPINSPKTSTYNVRSLKRPSLHSNIEESSEMDRTSKNYRVIAYKYENSPSMEKDKLSGSDLNKDNRVAMKKKINSVENTQSEQDSGIVLSLSEDMSTAKKSKKGKSVTFSQGTKAAETSVRDDKLIEPQTTSSEVVKKIKRTTDDKKQSIDRNDSLPGMKARFFSEASLHSVRLSPIVKSKKKTKVPLRTSLKWKDLQESRREAWQRSQKLLDEVEESIAKETGTSVSLSVAGSITSGVTSSIIPTASIGSSIAQGLPLTLLTTTASSTLTKTTFSTQNILPSSQNTAPSFQGVVPSTNNTLPPNQNILPSGQNLLPQSQKIPSLTTNILPPTQNILPPSQNTVPSSQNTVPPTQNIPPLTQTSSGGLVNFGGNALKSVQQGSTTTLVTTKSLGNNPLLNPASEGIPTSTQNVTTANPVLSTTTSTTSFTFGETGVSTNPVNKSGTTDSKFDVPKGPVQSQPSTFATLPFSGFGAALGSSPSVSQSTTSSFTFKSTASNLRVTTSTQPTLGGFGQPASSVSQSNTNLPAFSLPTSLPQTTSVKTFGLQTTGLATTIPQTTTTSSFTFQAPSQPQTTTSFSTFSFQAPASQSSQPASVPAAQTEPSGLFNFNTGLATVGGFGATSSQSSKQSGFSFGSESSVGGQQKSGGFSFNAETVPKPAGSSGGFNFSQATTGTFAFGSSAPGGFAFGASTTGPGAPFAASTPMPGSSGGVPGGMFTLGSTNSTGQASSRRKARQRKK